MTTATISTRDDDATLHPLPTITHGEPRYYSDATLMPKASEADAYVYTTRQLGVGGSGGGGGGYDLEAAGKKSAGAAAGDGESYELQHVRSNGSVV